MSSSYVAPEKVYFYLDPANSHWCISNTMLCFMYTAFSFMSICFIVMGRQIVYSKRNRSVYMDAIEEPDDSDAEDDKVEAEKSKEQTEGDSQ